MTDKLPLIPAGATAINQDVAVDRSGRTWTYMLNMLPVYAHNAHDKEHFRLVIAQLVEASACRACEIIKTFGITKNKVMRACRQLRERGVRSFFEPRCGRRTGTVLTAEKLAEAQDLLDSNLARSEVAKELGIKPDTLRKAINDGRLTEPPRREEPAVQPSSSSQRSRADTAAGQEIGTACTRVEERVFAAAGMVKGAPTRFEPCLDVPNAGALCAVPALLANGLLAGLEKLGTVHGYYTAEQTLLSLGLMFICRIRTVEALRRNQPGELGKLIGLDRIAEARCLRMKMDQLAGEAEAENWAAFLCRRWLEEAGCEAGFLYVDGHVRVYAGRLKIPRRYISRQRLCLRGISDYWVNDAIGQPFFVVERQVDDGLIATLRRDIVPRLLADVPGQPSEAELEADKHLCRFVIVFDREGYSPAFFREMWDKHRIACMTYRKNCTDEWELSEFSEVEATMPRGEKVSMLLAERGTLLGSGEEAIWVKEVRRLTSSGHQTSVVSTAYKLQSKVVAPRMFTRWCQENYFNYAMSHYPIDLLCEYGAEPFADDQRIVNPAWRELTKQRNSARGKLTRRRAKFVELDGQKRADPKHKGHEKWLLRKAEVQEEIDALLAEIKRLTASRKETEHYITWGELPKKEKELFLRLPSGRRRLVNTVGMICYRAETALANLLCEGDSTLSSTDARALLQGLFETPGDLLPDAEAGTLEVRVHGSSTPAANRRLAALFKPLNETETVFPGTNLKLVFSSVLPADDGRSVPPLLPPDQDP